MPFLMPCLMWPWTVIAKKQGKQSTYFTSRENYNQFYEIVSRTWRVAIPTCREVFHAFILKWLHAKGEAEAAEWFAKQWEGKSWMLCDIGYGMAGGNNGQEVSHRYNHGATGGNKKNISLTYFLANLSKFMADYSERLAAR